MKTKLLIAVLGTRNAGKSTTWYRLFGRTVRTGWKEVSFGNDEYAEVYLINGSPEERGFDVVNHLQEPYPDIVLCSVQFTEHGKQTLSWFHDNGYKIFVQWLNPGHADGQMYPDSLGFKTLFQDDYEFTQADGSVDPTERVEIVKDYIHKWAEQHGLVRMPV